LVKDTVIASESFQHLNAFFRGLKDKVEIESVTKAGRFFYLILTETVKVTGAVFRGMLLFVRIVTGVFVRDYILERFLKARSDIFIKSRIQREIVLNSKIK